MGIDPGLANTGWAVIETNGIRARARAYDCISTSSSLSLDERLATIARRINAALQVYHPQAVAVEKIFFGQNHKSAISTAHARAAALVACGTAHLDLGEYTPMQIKQAVVGTGSANKHQVTYMVRFILQLDHDPKPDHCADALAAALCHFTMACSAMGRASLRPVPDGVSERSAIGTAPSCSRKGNGLLHPVARVMPQRSAVDRIDQIPGGIL